VTTKVFPAATGQLPLDGAAARATGWRRAERRSTSARRVLRFPLGLSLMGNLARVFSSPGKDLSGLPPAGHVLKPLGQGTAG
jgi:hypothetical protein